IGISVVSGVVSAKAEYDRQVAEGDNYTNWGSVIFVGVANAGVSFVTFGLGQGATLAAGAGAKAVLKHVGKAVIRDVALGAATDAGVETARQLVTGTKITNLEYDRITEAGVYGGINGGVSSLAGAGLEGLMRTRVAQKALVKLNVVANKGADAIKNGFAKIANKNGKTVGLEAVVESGSGSVADFMNKTDFIDETPRLNGTLYGSKKLQQLENYLGRRGIEVKVGDEFLPPGKAGGFNAETGKLYLRSNPTQYEVWHELSHYIQYQKIGKEDYLALPRTVGENLDLGAFNAPEQFVYDMLSNNPRRWGRLSYEEQIHANWYITTYGGIR
ncbi:MAG: hypothetical protein IKT67_10395, partial [Lachnospiraceae bacterium]|nr:hypothetical protein [Lachnospiraceae bacterium]